MYGQYGQIRRRDKLQNGVQVHRRAHVKKNPTRKSLTCVNSPLWGFKRTHKIIYFYVLTNNCPFGGLQKFY